MFPTLEFLFPLFSFFTGLYRLEQPQSFTEPTHLQFKLRHEHAVSSDGHIFFSDVSPRWNALTEGNQTIFTIATKTISAFRPPSLRTHEDARRRSLQHAESTDLAWWEDEIIGPDVEHRETLLELAKMTNNAYITADDAEWYELDKQWADVRRFFDGFGWTR